MGVSTDRKWHLVLKGGKLDSKGISHVRISFTRVRDCIPTVTAVIARSFVRHITSLNDPECCHAKH